MRRAAQPSLCHPLPPPPGFSLSETPEFIPESGDSLGPRHPPGHQRGDPGQPAAATLFDYNNAPEIGQTVGFLFFSEEVFHIHQKRVQL